MSDTAIQAHYDNSHPADRAGPRMDQLHVRGAASTLELAKLLDPQPNDVLLDIGGGIGGPARSIASSYDCLVHSIDYTEGLCHQALQISLDQDMTEKTAFACADATRLPDGDDSVDKIYSQHEIMNIPDKAAFYSEAWP